LFNCQYTADKCSTARIQQPVFNSQSGFS
jgi:hypothetical protein